MSIPIFQNITIIGSGLIGSSLARAIRQRWREDVFITGCDKDSRVRGRAQALNLYNKITEDPSLAVADADLVLLCVPVGAMAEVGKAIGDSLKQGCVLSDTGSVKSSVIRALEPHVHGDVTFIPAHPIAGTEKFGPDAGDAELFQGSWCVFTPLPETDESAIGKLEGLWKECGAKVTFMDADEHDTIFAVTSHVPHLIAFCIVDMATKFEEVKAEDVIKFSAGGFKDFTRIAASDVIMWRDIFLNNQDVVAKTLERFSKDIMDLCGAISDNDIKKIEETIRGAQGVRDKILEADKSLEMLGYAKSEEEEEEGGEADSFYGKTLSLFSEEVLSTIDNAGTAWQIPVSSSRQKNMTLPPRQRDRKVV